MAANEASGQPPGRRPAPAGGDRRRVDLAASGLAVLVATAWVVAALRREPDLPARDPGLLVFVLASLVGGAFTVLPAGIASPWSSATWSRVGHGTLALLAGFQLQSLLNGGLAHLVPAPARGLAFDVGLGVGAGLSQTAGKALVLAWLARLFRGRRGPEVLRDGLAVGLGFGLAEIVFIATRLVPQAEPMPLFAPIAIWERLGAVGFHVYSAGLVAIAIRARAAVPAVAVVLLHSFSDTLAGPIGHTVLGLPVVALEGLFTVTTLVTWALFRVRAGPALAPDATASGPPEEAGEAAGGQSS